eukprot:COSAG03_NODE_118_length_12325_cov_11.481515_2_plen_187_part_00
MLSSWFCSTPSHNASGFQIASHGFDGSIAPVELTDCGPSMRGSAYCPCIWPPFTSPPIRKWLPGGERAARESRQQIGRRIDDGEEEARRILTDLQPGTCVILGNAPTWEVFQPSAPRRGWVPAVVFYRGELGMSPDGVMLLGADGRRYLATLCFGLQEMDGPYGAPKTVAEVRRDELALDYLLGYA